MGVVEDEEEDERGSRIRILRSLQARARWEPEGDQAPVESYASARERRKEEVSLKDGSSV
jgi:hypothetical protein